MTPDFQPFPESGFCAQCGTANVRTAAFCAKCGAPLPWAAPKTEPVTPQVVAPVAAAAAPVPPPPPMMPPPPVELQAPAAQAQPVTPPPPQPTPQPIPAAPVPEWVPHLGKILFPRELLTAYKGATPQELLRLYGPRVVGLVLLVVAIKIFAYTIVSLLAVGTLVCLVIGLKNPETFRPVFGAKTSKSTIIWSFGALMLVLGMIGSSMDPTRENADSAPVAIPNAPRPAEQQAPPTQSQLTRAPVLPTKRVVPARVVPSPALRKRTPQQTIENAMRDQFGDRLRQVEVKRLVRDIYDVRVEFNNSVRMTTKATKDYMEGDMQDAYKAIFTSGFNIGEAKMEAFGSGTDKYGQPFSAPAYKTLLESEVASKSNWKDHRAARWDDLWTVFFIHRQYRDENLGRNWKKEEEEARRSSAPQGVE